MTGKDLINMGYKPEKWFGKALEYAKSNPTKEELVKYIDSIQVKHIEPFKHPVGWNTYIRPYDEFSVDNLQAVNKTMVEVMKTPTVSHGAIMPDACPTGEIGQIPVGGVVVTKNAIHPAMHSADICCSVFATDFGFTNPKEVLDMAHSVTHFGGGGRDTFSDFGGWLGFHMTGNPFLDTPRSLELCKTHIGTQGDGNHFLYVGIRESDGHTMMVTHHGSRGFGANLYKEGMKVAERFRRELSPKTLKRNAWIPFNTKEGQDYWEALQLVRDWTKNNHKAIHYTTASRLDVGITPDSYFWNEHNFVFKDGDLFYHAKGATPMLDEFVPDSENGLRLIPLNMAEPILIAKDSGKNPFGFAPHGAGRNVSRSAHIRSKEGLSVEEIMEQETRGLDIRFFSGEPDISELPSAYKNADEVTKQIEEFGLAEVVDRINPYGCIMAGKMTYHKK